MIKQDVYDEVQSVILYGITQNYLEMKENLPIS